MALSEPELEVVVPAQALDLGDGAAPRNQEGLEAPFDGIFDKRVSRAEIEQIIFVDAGRHDHERRFLDLGRLRGILDQLDQFVLEHDRSGRCGKIATDFEDRLVDAGDPPLLQILDQILHSGYQARRAGPDCGPNDLRIGCREIRGTHRIDKLPRVEAKLQL